MTALRNTFDLPTVEPFSTKSLFHHLSNPLATPDDVAQCRQAQYLSRYLPDVNSKSIVVETDYVDADYLDDFSTYYVRCFRDYSRKCKRLHFFSTSLDQKQIISAIRGNPHDTQLLQNSYLGFCVARPLPKAILGRTLIHTYPIDSGRRNYTCTKPYNVNLYGIDLKVDTLAFQMQDTVIAACATVALWSCLHKAAEEFGTAIPRPATITRVANQVIKEARPFPSSGLEVDQICNAINYAGLEPEVYEIYNKTPLISLIYSYVKMGLPVVLVVFIEGVGRHAITIAGYSMKKDAIHDRETGTLKVNLRLMGLRINEFYGHDDQIGPFARLVVKKGATYKKRSYPVTFEGAWENSRNHKARRIFPDAIIVPVYSKIRLTFYDVYKWLVPISDILTTLILPPNSDAIWDVHLTTNNRYKKSLRDQAPPLRLRERILLRQHPRFIWRARLLLDDVEVLEVLADATDINRSFPIYQIIWQSDDLQQAVASLFQVVPPNSLKEMLTNPLYTEIKKSLT